MEENTKEDKVENMSEKVTENTKENAEFQYAEGTKLRPCKHCGSMIPKKAKICPNCKLSQKGKTGRILFILLLIAIAAGAAVVYLRNSENMHSQNDGMSGGEPMAATTTALLEETTEETVPGEDTGGKAAVETAVGETAVADKAIEENAVQETETDESGTSPEDEDTQIPSIFGEGLSEEDDSDDPALKGAEEGIGSLFKSGELADAEGATQEEEEPDITGAEYAEAVEDLEMTNVVNSKDYTEEEFRGLCTEIGYKKLLREKEQYLGAALLLEVTVMSQVDGGLFDSNVYYLCKATDEQGIERYYILRDDRTGEESAEVPEEEIMLILEGDRVLVYGQLFDSCKLPAYLISSQPIVPAVSMVYVDIEE